MEKFKKIGIFLRGADDLKKYKTFVGCCLEIEAGGCPVKIEKLKRSREFPRKVRQELHKFLENNSYTTRNVARYFSQSICLFSGLRKKRGAFSGKTIHLPESLRTCIYISCPENYADGVNAETDIFFLVSNVKLSEMKNLFGQKLKVKNFNDAMCFLDVQIKNDTTFSMKNIRYLVQNDLSTKVEFSLKTNFLGNRFKIVKMTVNL